MTDPEAAGRVTVLGGDANTHALAKTDDRRVTPARRTRSTRFAGRSLPSPVFAGARAYRHFRRAPLVAVALRLEAEHLVAVATGNREAGARSDADLDRVLAGLERRGAAHPLHALASRYQLTGGEYAVLITALLPDLAPDLFEALSARSTSCALGAAVLADAHRVVTGGTEPFGGCLSDEQAAFEVQLRATTLVRERLVELVSDGATTRLRAHQAVRELVGLS